jgi:hypothetical protein
MLIRKTNTKALNKVYATLSRMEEYKTEVKGFLEGLSRDGIRKHAGRMPQLLLTHFTSEDNAVSIISDGEIKPSERGYLSLSALHPLEFKTITGKDRRVGFGFFVDDLLKGNLEIYSPIAASRKDGVVAELETKCPDLAKLLICEATDSQPALRFLNQMEVRCTVPVPLELCSLFFRERDIEGVGQTLEDLGVFQLPYSVSWFRDHFIENQSWFFRESAETFELFDNRVCQSSTEDVIAKLGDAIK